MGEADEGGGEAEEIAVGKATHAFATRWSGCLLCTYARIRLRAMATEEEAQMYADAKEELQKGGRGGEGDSRGGEGRHAASDGLLHTRWTRYGIDEDSTGVSSSSAPAFVGEAPREHHNYTRKRAGARAEVCIPDEMIKKSMAAAEEATEGGAGGEAEAAEEAKAARRRRRRRRQGDLGVGGGGGGEEKRAADGSQAGRRRRAMAQINQPWSTRPPSG